MEAAAIVLSYAVFLLVFVVLPIALQIWLSKLESKYPGLILPAICFLFSVIVSIFSVYMRDMVLSVLIFNIPTVIHLLIYFACREKLSKKRQIDKMNLQDL